MDSIGFDWSQLALALAAALVLGMGSACQNEIKRARISQRPKSIQEIAPLNPLNQHEWKNNQQVSTCLDMDWIGFQIIPIDSKSHVTASHCNTPPISPPKKGTKYNNMIQNDANPIKPLRVAFAFPGTKDAAFHSEPVWPRNQQYPKSMQERSPVEQKRHQDLKCMAHPYSRFFP